MYKISRTAVIVAGLAMAGHAAAQVTLHESEQFQGRSFTTSEQVSNLRRAGFNDRVSSVSVQGDRSQRWEVCEDRRFRGACVVLRQGDYPSIAAMGLNERISSVRAIGRNVRIDDRRYAPMPAPPAPASQAVFYEKEDFKGRSLTADAALADLRRSDFNDRASSVVVSGERWEVCQNIRYSGHCVVLRPGPYASLAAMGLDDRIASFRTVSESARIDERRYAPMPRPEPASQVVLYGREGFQGRSFTADTPISDLRRTGFNDRASSAVVTGERWEVCDTASYAGRCAVLRPGQYASLAAMGLNDSVSSVRAVSPSARIDDRRYAPIPRPEQISEVVFYAREGFQGGSFTADAPVDDLRRSGFNDRASSAVVRGERWEVCDTAGYTGRCAVLRPGQYASLQAMGLNDSVSSVRAVSPSARIDDRRYAPAPATDHDYGRRNNERTYEAPITSVRAVVEEAGQRCWVEREQVVQERSGTNAPGALLGALIGGVLGHQVGGGTGKDVATGLGVIAGAVIGANSGKLPGSQQVTTQDVQRCTSAPGQARPAYWEVTYTFRGVEHRMQMATPPGATVSVNEQGEPRV
jgi:uncharacterized protein YcfJ